MAGQTSDLQAYFQTDRGINPGSEIRQIRLQRDGKIIIAGDFDYFRGVPRSGMARLNWDGSIDLMFDAGAGVRDALKRIVRLNDLVMDEANRFYLAGPFVTVNGVARANVARLAVSGELDNSFLPRVSEVHAMAVQENGKLLVGGRFTQVNGVSRGGLARLNEDGSLDLSFPQGPGIEFLGEKGGIDQLHIDAQGRVIVGGAFSRIGGYERIGLARLHPDGSVDETFKSEWRPESGVRFVVLPLPNGQLLAGQFNVVRLNQDGSVDRSFDTTGMARLSSETKGIIHALALGGEGTILAGGRFNEYGASKRSSLVRLRPDGSVDTTPDRLSALRLEDRSGSEVKAGAVFSLTTQRDASILFGGLFTHVNDVEQRGMGCLIAGTVEAAVMPALTRVERFEGRVKVTFPTVKGKHYMVQHSDSLKGSGWTSLPAIMGDGTVKTVTLYNVDDNWRFFRLRIR